MTGVLHSFEEKKKSGEEGLRDGVFVLTLPCFTF